MKIFLNCCSKPSLFKQNGMPLFKGGEKASENVKAEPKKEVVAEIKPQVEKDTVELSEKAPKKPEPKCEGGNCK